MSHSQNKMNCCLKKAEKELKNGDTHRGFIIMPADKDKAKKHVIKAEHYIEATIYLKKGNFSDISASTAFYATYHCLLAIAAKFGYESRNQECTFALIATLIEDGNIDFDRDLLAKIYDFQSRNDHSEQTIVEIREQYQYGTSLSLKENLYDEQLALVKRIITKTKEIIEK